MLALVLFFLLTLVGIIVVVASNREARRSLQEKFAQRRQHKASQSSRDGRKRRGKQRRSGPRKKKAHKERRRNSLGLDDLARRMGVDRSELESFTPRYRTIKIPKRSGGQRVLQIPDDATKRLQRRLMFRVLASLNAHPLAFGFEKGRSIVDHASLHTNQLRVIRIDVVDFFPNTRERCVRSLFERVGWNREATEWLCRLTTLNDGLPQGAPTSPRISNLVNVHLDRRMDGLAKAFGARYSRYADDITFSFDQKPSGKYASRPLRVRIEAVRQTAARILSMRGYRMHTTKKHSVTAPNQRQMVTGLVVNQKVALPREKRRWLRAVQHRYKTGREATITASQLQGWMSYQKMVTRTGWAKAELDELRQWQAFEAPGQARLDTTPNAEDAALPQESTSQDEAELCRLISRFEDLPDDQKRFSALPHTMDTDREQVLRVKVKVDREYRRLGVDAPTHLRGGCEIFASVAQHEERFSIRFDADQCELAESLRVDREVELSLRLSGWDTVFDQAVFESITQPAKAP